MPIELGSGVFGDANSADRHTWFAPNRIRLKQSFLFPALTLGRSLVPIQAPTNYRYPTNSSRNQQTVQTRQEELQPDAEPQRQ
jgi:hypothetical protein